MSRNAKIEAILETWWDSIYCEPSARAEVQIRLNRLVDDTIGKEPMTRDDVFDYLYPRFQEYRKERRNKETLIIAQSRKQ